MEICKFSWQFSYVPSYILATVVGYLLHNFYTFKVGGISLNTSLAYIIQSVLVLVLGFSIVYILVQLNLSPQVSKIIQLFATFFFNIAFGRYITFRKGNL
jgi:putative flippase GtrA